MIHQNPTKEKWPLHLSADCTKSNKSSRGTYPNHRSHSCDPFRHGRRRQAIHVSLDRRNERHGWRGQARPSLTIIGNNTKPRWRGLIPSCRAKAPPPRRCGARKERRGCRGQAPNKGRLMPVMNKHPRMRERTAHRGEPLADRRLSQLLDIELRSTSCSALTFSLPILTLRLVSLRRSQQHRRALNAVRSASHRRLPRSRADVAVADRRRA